MQILFNQNPFDQIVGAPGNTTDPGLIIRAPVGTGSGNISSDQSATDLSTLQRALQGLSSIRRVIESAIGTADPAKNGKSKSKSQQTPAGSIASALRGTPARGFQIATPAPGRIAPTILRGTRAPSQLQLAEAVAQFPSTASRLGAVAVTPQDQMAQSLLLQKAFGFI